MIFFAVFLQKLEPSCKIGAFSAAIFRNAFVWKMAAAVAFFVTVSYVICRYHVYKEVWNPSIGEAYVFIKHGGEINSNITLPLLKIEVFPNFRDGE